MQAWFQAGVWRKKKKYLNAQSIMPGYNHLKIVALKNSTDIIVAGQGELQRINDRSLTFTIKSIPFQHLHPWFAVGEIILLQKLAHNGRAIPVQQQNSDKKQFSIIQRLIMDMNDDVCRTILSFLVYSPLSCI